MAEEYLKETMEMEGPRQRTVGQNKPFKSHDLTPMQLKAVVGYVTKMANEYFTHPDFSWYKQRVIKLQHWINQEPPPQEKGTSFGFVRNFMRAGYDYYTDSIIDIYDVDDMIMFEADGSRTEEIASDLSSWVNNLLRISKYKEHLARRFAYIPDYGWSPAMDSFEYNSGWDVKPKAMSSAKGLEGFEFTAEQDMLRSWPKPKIIKPLDWFGSPFHCMTDMPFQGHVERKYIFDLQKLKSVTDENDQPIYNNEAIDKLIKKVSRGDRDSYEHKSTTDNSQRGHGNDNERSGNHLGYVDVFCFYGTLEQVDGFSSDSNTYYIECTSDELLRFHESPLDRETAYTHMQSHPLRDNPFTRSFLDSIREHQIFSDTLTNIALENTIDSAHRYWTYHEEDIVNYDSLFNPTGLNTFLQMSGDRVPQILEGRSSTLGDLANMIQLIERDKEAVSFTQQDVGANSSDGKKTATENRIQAAAANKKIRSFAKRINEQAIKPQIKNLIMMQMVHGNPLSNQVISSDGKPIQLKQEHIEYFFSGAGMRMVDQITQDWTEMSNKLVGWYQMGAQMLPQLAQPGPAIEMMRQGGIYSGLPRAVVDKILPEDGMEQTQAPVQNVPPEIQAMQQGGLPDAMVQAPMEAPIPGQG